MQSNPKLKLCKSFNVCTRKVHALRRNQVKLSLKASTNRKPHEQTQTMYYLGYLSLPRTWTCSSNPMRLLIYKRILLTKRYSNSIEVQQPGKWTSKNWCLSSKRVYTRTEFVTLAINVSNEIWATKQTLCIFEVLKCKLCSVWTLTESTYLALYI